MFINNLMQITHFFVIFYKLFSSANYYDIMFTLSSVSAPAYSLKMLSLYLDRNGQFPNCQLWPFMVNLYSMH